MIPDNVGIGLIVNSKDLAKAREIVASSGLPYDDIAPILQTFDGAINNAEQQLRDQEKTNIEGELRKTIEAEFEAEKAEELDAEGTSEVPED